MQYDGYYGFFGGLYNCEDTAICLQGVKIIAKYDSAFKGTSIRSISHYNVDSLSSGHLYIARIDGIDEARRNEIIIKMAQAGIATNVHYKPLPMFSGYKKLGFDIKDYPNAYDLYRNEIIPAIAYFAFRRKKLSILSGSLRRL